MVAELEGWIKAEGDLHSGLWPSQSELRLWYKTRAQLWDGMSRGKDGTRQGMTHDDYDIITELDVVYGDSDPFYGFERVEGGKVTKGKEGRWESVDLAYRRGNPGQF